MLIFQCLFDTQGNMSIINIYESEMYSADKDKSYKFVNILDIFAKGQIKSYDYHYCGVKVTCKFCIGVLLY